MVNTNKLKGKIVEKGLSVSELATAINVDKATLYRKMNGVGKGFTIEEADRIADILELSIREVNAIFFSQYVA